MNQSFVKEFCLCHEHNILFKVNSITLANRMLLNRDYDHPVTFFSVDNLYQVSTCCLLVTLFCIHTEEGDWIVIIFV